jgi:intron-binding protein aquarius
MFPTTRALDAPVDGTAMESVEHLGQYVFEMTQAKVKAMGDGEMVVDGATANGEEPPLDEDEEMLGADEDQDENIV